MAGEAIEAGKVTDPNLVFEKISNNTIPDYFSRDPELRSEGGGLLFFVTVKVNGKWERRERKAHIHPQRKLRVVGTIET